MEKHNYFSKYVELEMIVVEPKRTLKSALEFYFSNQIDEIICPECEREILVPAHI